MKTRLRPRITTRNPNLVVKPADLMAMKEWCPVAELTTRGSDSVIRVELPECALQNITARTENFTLTITAERDPPTYPALSSHRAPCFSAAFAWKFALPVDVPGQLLSKEVDGSVVTLRFGSSALAWV